MKLTTLLLSFFVLFQLSVSAKKKDVEEEAKGDTIINSSLVSGLKFRNIGPAWASGRIADFAVNPKNPKEYYVGVASGNVWKTQNSGTTWKPVFDKYGAYSIGVVEIDPNNSNVVWVGTGENNHQRALGYGDGVYKSMDGGKSFKNMGLKESRQIGGIVIDPRNSDVVFVACEGSVWGPGGDRGLYKTTDGGKEWKKVLDISENTGVNNVVIDPKDPNIMYATSEQRRRHHFTKIGGGPESAVYKSTDGGENWRKIMEGLPKVHIGGMGIDVSPVDTNVLYLIVEAQDDKGGFFRSTDKGESWNKMSDHASSGQYYNEIYCDPKDVDKVYSVETFTHFTEDGGKTWKQLGNNKRHVDDHALWIDPNDTDHFLIGGDGGIYESWDSGSNFDFKENLPITQFYRVYVDNAKPFYHVYGGTQDNNSMGGPSQNISKDGVTNDEWVATLGGDGFWGAVDPNNPDIVYSEYQYGNIYRFDKKSSEEILIKPNERKDELAYKWNWDAPFLLSHHSPSRLYIAANKVFRSEDRGNSWKVISEDLTAQVDRNSFPVMDKYWSADAVVKDVSSSQWGTIVAMDESRLDENLLYVGTDDGVISITENGGESWTQIKEFPGVPKYTYVSELQTDRFDKNVVYAAFNNLKMDDFKPYLLRSTDKGKTWISISGNLPENGTVHTFAQDFVNPNLWFAGTEFGIFFSVDNGENWVQLKSGMPTIAIRDIAIQERESDLVLATFGRGFYILDNFSPLREVTHDLVDKDAYLFPVKTAKMFVQSSGRSNQGSTYYFAKNPDFGAVFTYYLKEVPKTKKEIRKEKEKELFKDGKPIPQPSWRELELEKKEEKPHLIFTVYDEDGDIIRKIAKSPSKGINRINWDLKLATTRKTDSKEFDPVKKSRGSIFAMPGNFKVGLEMFSGGKLTELIEPINFNCEKLNIATLAAEDYAEVVDFGKKVNKLSVAMTGAAYLTSELIEKVENIKQTLYNTPQSPASLMSTARKIADQLEEIRFKFHGIEAKASWEEIPPAKLPLLVRLRNITYVHYGSTSAITETERTSYNILKEEFPPVLEELKTITEKELPKLNEELNRLGAPWTSGRVPVWND